MRSGQRVEVARWLLNERGASLAEDFRQSLAESERFFARHDPSTQPLYPAPRALTRPPGLGSSAALGHHLDDLREQTWSVRDDASLDFHYLDRELVSTRAPGERLKGARSSMFGRSNPNTTTVGLARPSSSTMSSRTSGVAVAVNAASGGRPTKRKRGHLRVTPR